MSDHTSDSVEEFLKSAQPEIRGILARHRIPPEDADDVVQQAMVALVYNWETIKTPQAWLAGTIRHKCLLYWRQRRRRLYQTVDTVLLELVADGEQPRQERLDLINDLNALISRLPPRCQELLRLRYGLGLGINEVAEEMGYQRGSVSKVTARCLAALNREMVLAGFFSKGAAARLSPLKRACLGR